MATSDLENENQALKEALTSSRVASDNQARKLEKDLRAATERVGYCCCCGGFHCPMYLVSFARCGPHRHWSMLDYYLVMMRALLKRNAHLKRPFLVLMP